MMDAEREQRIRGRVENWQHQLKQIRGIFSENIPLPEDACYLFLELEKARAAVDRSDSGFNAGVEAVAAFLEAPGSSIYWIEMAKRIRALKRQECD